MKKKSNISPAIAVRLNKDDKAQVDFIKQKLTKPGLTISISESIKRAIYVYAEQLRNENDRESVK